MLFIKSTVVGFMFEDKLTIRTKFGSRLYQVFFQILLIFFFDHGSPPPHSEVLPHFRLHRNIIKASYCRYTVLRWGRWTSGLYDSPSFLQASVTYTFAQNSNSVSSDQMPRFHYKSSSAISSLVYFDAA